MEIIVAKNSGFCSGVKAAIDKATSIEGGCVTLGKLIHNENVIKELEAKNIKSINTLDEYTSGVLLIRSHGVGKDVYEELKKRKINYLDATCPFVKKIHKIVEENYKNGLDIIIFGDQNHPEVIGINGWCDYTATVVNSEEDIQKIDKTKKYCTVCQTTFDTLKYKNIIKIIKNTCNLVVINDTICYTTTCRQEEAQKLSKKCDLILVIGSKTSSNTTKLYNICSASCKTYQIETIADLKSVEYKNNSIIGVVAGASTPQGLIEEVKTQMSESQETKNVVVDSAEKTITSFADFMESAEAKNIYKPTKNIKVGQTYTLKVISANDEGIKVNFQGKKDGFIPADEVEASGVEYVAENYKEGDSLRAKCIDAPKNADKSVMYFSKKVIEQSTKDYEEYKAVLMQPEFKAKITKAIKGGLAANVGPYSVFVPSSQIKMGKSFVIDKDLEKYVGKELRLRAIKSKKDTSEGDEIVIKPGKTVYASQSVILQEEHDAAEKALWEKLVEDTIITGKVVRIKDFGAFVKVDNGFECLAHKTNLSYKKDAQPADVLQVGKSYEFIILSVDKEKRQVSLGYKQLQKSLYEEAFEKYPVGSVIKGKVRDIQPYGAYVSIEDGVDGLVPVAEMAHKYVKHPEDVCKMDEEVEAQVIKFDVEKSKITLSMKALIPQEVKEEVTEDDYKASQEKRTARNLKKFENVEAPKKKTSKKAAVVEEEETTTFSSDSAASVSIGELLKNLLDK